MKTTVLTIRKRVSYRAIAEFLRKLPEPLTTGEIETRAKSYANSLTIEQGDLDSETLIYLARYERKHGKSETDKLFNSILLDEKMKRTREYIRQLLNLAPLGNAEIATLICEKFRVKVNAKTVLEIRKAIDNGTLSGKSLTSYVDRKDNPVSLDVAKSIRGFFRTMFEKYVVSFVPECDKVKMHGDRAQLINTSEGTLEKTGKKNEIPQNEAIITHVENIVTNLGTILKRVYVDSLPTNKGVSFPLVSVDTYKETKREYVTHYDKQGKARIKKNKQGLYIDNAGKFVVGELVTLAMSLFAKHEQDIQEDKSLFFSQDGKVFKSFTKHVPRFGLFDVINDAMLVMWYDMSKRKANKEKNPTEQEWLDLARYHVNNAFYIRMDESRKLDSLEVGFEHSDFEKLQDSRRETIDGERIQRAYIPLSGISLNEESFEETLEANTIPVGFSPKEMRRQRASWLDNVKENIASELFTLSTAR